MRITMITLSLPPLLPLLFWLPTQRPGRPFTTKPANPAMGRTAHRMPP